MQLGVGGGFLHCRFLPHHPLLFPAISLPFLPPAVSLPSLVVLSPTISHIFQYLPSTLQAVAHSGVVGAEGWASLSVALAVPTICGPLHHPHTHGPPYKQMLIWLEVIVVS